VPAGGLSFGAAAHPEAIVDMPYQFDFYDAGLDQAFLGMAQVDRHGNVNVSRFAGRLPGAGGFIEISQAARSVVFMGTFTTGAEVVVADRRLRVQRDGTAVKFVDQVEHITFSAERARATRQSVLYITERCVFRLGPGGLELIEIAPGIDLQRDLLARMSFRPEIAHDLCEMDGAILSQAPLGLSQPIPLTGEARLEYRVEDGLVLLDLNTSGIDSTGDAEGVARFLDRRLSELGRGPGVIVGCDGFDLGRPGATRLLQLLQDRERSRSWAWYCTDALLRRKLCRARSDDDLRQPVYPSYRQAVDALRRTVVATTTD